MATRIKHLQPYSTRIGLQDSVNTFDRTVTHYSRKTNSGFIIRPFEDKDSEAVINVLNYFCKHSFAAYPENQFGYDFIDYIKESAEGFPFYFIESSNNENVGFGYMHPYDQSGVFKYVGELTLFILPMFSGTGLGQILLDMIEQDARKMELQSLLSSISNLNDISLKFHIKNGFKVCGKFKQIGVKKGVSFDVIWVQKFL